MKEKSRKTSSGWVLARRKPTRRRRTSWTTPGCSDALMRKVNEILMVWIFSPDYMYFRIFHGFWKVFRFLPGWPGWWWYNDPRHWSPGICCPRPRWIFLNLMPRSSFGWAPGVPRLRSSWHTNLHRCSKYALRLCLTLSLSYQVYIQNLRAKQPEKPRRLFMTIMGKESKRFTRCFHGWGPMRTVPAWTKIFHLIGLGDHYIQEKHLSIWFGHY